MKSVSELLAIVQAFRNETVSSNLSIAIVSCLVRDDLPEVKEAAQETFGAVDQLFKASERLAEKLQEAADAE